MLGLGFVFVLGLGLGLGLGSGGALLGPAQGVAEVERRSGVM